MKPTAFDSLHPTIALGYFAVALALAMAAPHPLLLALSLTAALACGVWLRGAGTVVKSLGWQLPLMLIIVAVNPLFSSTGTTELFRIGTQAVYAEGYANALTMAALLLCVMQWFSNANAVLGSDKVMGALGGILPTISLMVSMIMRLIPRFVKRGRTINSALAACTAARAKHNTAVTSTAAQAGNNTAVHASNPSETISAPCAEGIRPTKRLSRVRFADQLRVSTTLMGWSMEDSLESADSHALPRLGRCAQTHHLPPKPLPPARRSGDNGFGSLSRSRRLRRLFPGKWLWLLPCPARHAGQPRCRAVCSRAGIPLVP